jgi:hypothetical protein
MNVHKENVEQNQLEIEQDSDQSLRAESPNGPPKASAFWNWYWNRLQRRPLPSFTEVTSKWSKLNGV